MKVSLAAARVNANLTQSEAAERIGVNRSTLINWENARSYPTIPQIKKIEEVYHCSYDDIFFDYKSTLSG